MSGLVVSKQIAVPIFAPATSLRVKLVPGVMLPTNASMRSMNGSQPRAGTTTDGDQHRVRRALGGRRAARLPGPRGPPGSGARGLLPLGRLSPRGERGLLTVSTDTLMRLSSNPFFSFVAERIGQWVVARDPGEPSSRDRQ